MYNLRVSPHPPTPKEKFWVRLTNFVEKHHFIIQYLTYLLHGAESFLRS